MFCGPFQAVSRPKSQERGSGVEWAVGDVGLLPSRESPHLGHQGLLTLAWSGISVAHIPPAQGLGPGALTFSLVSPQFLEERVGRTHAPGWCPLAHPPPPLVGIYGLKVREGCVEEKRLSSWGRDLSGAGTILPGWTLGWSAHRSSSGHSAEQAGAETELGPLLSPLHPTSLSLLLSST